MRVPLGWLGDFVPPPADREALARRLTLAGLEVTAIERIGGDWERVVVGRVLEVKPHPGADRLVLVTVDAGADPVTVVCGAPNVAAEQDIAFASAGAVLNDPGSGAPRALKKSRIRGVVSAGMVCSEAELGLSAEHAGILVLEPGASPGTPLREVLGDHAFVFDLTPNRVDALSVFGVAREIAALTGAPLTPLATDLEPRGDPVSGRAGAEIRDPDLCRRFTLALIEEVEVRESPAWMRERLVAAGMRPINNLVDITNYVMLETGQPVHAFDAGRVRDRRIIVRRARAGERLATLDGSELALDPERLVIADPDGPIALAGVMGGRDSEITGNTREVLLEVANFDPASVRRTARATGLFTDAARRFSWGLPPELAAVASGRVCRLLAEHAGGRVAAGRLDVWPAPEPRPEVRLRRSRIPQVLGMEVPGPTVRAVLGSLGFEVAGKGEELAVRPPWWRRDVRVPDDLVEEVARVVGYDDLPAAPLSGEIPHHPPLPARELRERVRDLAADAGLREVVNYSLVSEADLAPWPSPDPSLRIRNPLGQARDTLRTSLAPGILRAAARNFDHGAKQVALFEVGRTYHAGPQTGDGRPSEVERAAGLVAGVRFDRFGRPSDEGLDFFDAKATLERVLSGLRVEASFRAADHAGFVAGRTATVAVAGVALGILGQIHPSAATGFGIERDLFFWELDLTALLARATEAVGEVAAVPPPRFPSAAEDFALRVGPDAAAEDLRREAESHPLVAEAQIFDDYREDGGARSLGISVRYQAPNRTLAERDLAKVRRAILKRLRSRHGAVVREPDA